MFHLVNSLIYVEKDKNEPMAIKIPLLTLLIISDIFFKILIFKNLNKIGSYS